MWNREKVKEITISKIKEYIPESIQITEEMRIIKDLKIIGDDASEIILRIQDITGAKPPLKIWGNVETVGDIIDVITDHIKE